MKRQQTIPTAQKNILISSLNTLETALNTLKNSDCQELGYLKFDILTLKSLLKYEIQVVISEKDFQNFTSENGVDFPEYIN